MQIWPVSLKNRLKMYTFLRATKNRFEPVRTDSVACGFKRFFISEKPELQLTVRFFCGSVRFSCGFFSVVWTGPSKTRCRRHMEEEPNNSDGLRRGPLPTRKWQNSLRSSSDVHHVLLRINKEACLVIEGCWVCSHPTARLALLWAVSTFKRLAFSLAVEPFWYLF